MSRVGIKQTLQTHLKSNLTNSVRLISKRFPIHLITREANTFVGRTNEFVTFNEIDPCIFNYHSTSYSYQYAFTSLNETNGVWIAILYRGNIIEIATEREWFDATPCCFLRVKAPKSLHFILKILIIELSRNHYIEIPIDFISKHMHEIYESELLGVYDSVDFGHKFA